MTSELDNIAVVLMHTRDVRNIGGAVRAMKNTGLSQLRLVAPAPFAAEDITGIAHRSEDVLASMRVVPTLGEALADATYVVGTSARARGDLPARSDVRTLAAELRARAQRGRVALLFGPEDNGLDNAALDRCHALVRLPINPAYTSLNLAQAVLLLGYELWMAAPAQPAQPAASSQPATAADLEQCFAEAERALQAIQFFKSGSAPTMRALRQLLQRAEPQAREVALLTAIAREVQAFLRRTASQ
ncbi:RNA methyltransferase [Chloroflexia bacterium SDU3-3]|nr:RNA methyltransferase [Chloroflexia bacterium SDU3-3]